jgi:hypothetical protein
VNERQARSSKAIRSAVVFFDKLYAASSPELAHLHQRLRSTSKSIDQAAVDQLEVSGKLLASARQKLEQVREKHMLPLARLARRVFRGEVRIEAALRVPHKRAPAEELLAAAERMVKALQPHRRVLVASSIDPRRLSRLREETRIAKKLFAAADARTPRRTLATRRLPALLASARADLDAIDAIMTASSAGTELVQWRLISRVGKRLGRPRTRGTRVARVAKEGEPH